MLSDLRKILDTWSISGDTIVVAVSGGPDSVALLAALTEARPGARTICAHVNHQLRGSESDDDARFVKEIASGLGVECRITVASPDEESIQNRGVEAAAREARYAALHTIRRDADAAWIATGHSMDDQAETVLLRLLTNASIETLAGISRRTGDGIIRPLLDVRRATILQFIESRGLEYRVDSSNLDRRFLRNRIRHHLLPDLERRNEQAVPLLALIARHVHSIQSSLAPILKRYDDTWNRSDRGSSIDQKDLPGDPDLRRMVLLREIRRFAPDGREISGERLESLIEELHEGAPVSLGAGIDADIADGRLELRKGLSLPPSFSRPVRSGESVDVPEIGARVTIREAATDEELADPLRQTQVFSLPQGAEATFLVRTRLPGDRFQPLGMHREKKLKDVLIDRKIPASERDALLLLIHDDEIVWVAGVEISERFKVQPGRDLYRVRIDYANSKVLESI